MLGLDVDGVLTDNGVFIGPVAGERVELKRFDIQDGLGLILLRTAGLPVVWLSGRSSEATALRAAELRVEELLQVPGPRKVAAFAEVLQRRGIAWEEAAFVGDDLADLPVLRKVGLPIAVANAVPEVKAGGGARHRVPPAAMARCGKWSRHYSGPAASGPTRWPATFRSRLPVRLDDSALIGAGRRVLQLEAAAVAESGRRLGGEFARAVRLLAEAKGRVIVSGVGKSGLIARKLAVHADLDRHPGVLSPPGRFACMATSALWDRTMSPSC